MNHQPYENWLLDEKTLNPSEKEKLDQHLANCPKCARLEQSLRTLDHEFKTIRMVNAPENFSSRWQANLADRRKAHQSEQTRIIFISLSFTIVVASITVAAFLQPKVSPIAVFANLLSALVDLVNSISQFWTFIISFLEAAPVNLSIGIALTISLWLILTLLAWGISLYRITSKGIRATK